MTPTKLIRPLRDFLHTEMSGAVLLAIGAIGALVMANVGFYDVYHDLLSVEAGFDIGSFGMNLDLHHWINDGLMAVFFLVVGLEIKRELVEGELSSPKQAALPAVAALGGMIVPALLFVAVTINTPGGHAWGIPMATDIALALGVVIALGKRVPTSAKIFLLALAIVDDIGAIVVIAIFYSSGISIGHLIGSAVCIAAVVALAKYRPAMTWGFLVLGLAMWWFMFEAGIHATIAGVVMGLLTPTSPRVTEEYIDAEEMGIVGSVSSAKQTIEVAKGSVSRVEWLEHVLHPWSSLVIVPIFAFANAGVRINGDAISNAISSNVALGIVLGLVIGKPVGITAAVWIGRKFGLEMPEGLTMKSIAALGMVGGIGFTVSIFVADLALSAERIDAAKIAIIAASLVAGIAGAVVLSIQGKNHPDSGIDAGVDTPSEAAEFELSEIEVGVASSGVHSEIVTT